MREIEEIRLARARLLLSEIQKRECEESLIKFIRHHWHIVEPARPLVEGWPLHAVCEHLEAVTRGDIKRLLINLPPGFMKPVCVDEEVMTPRGPKRLGDVVVGDQVLTHKGRFRGVLAVHEQGVLPVVEVRTNAGRAVQAAPDHPFLTTRGWVAAGELKPGDVAATVALGIEGTVQAETAPQTFDEGPLLPDPVIEVVEAGEAECRCLTVDEDHSFTAGGLAVHNSLTLNVFWPAWEWGPRNLPSRRHIGASYSETLTIRDNEKCRLIVNSALYQQHWGDRVQLNPAMSAKTKFGNMATGWKLATSISGVGTGERGDCVCIDDPNSVLTAESKAVRESTNRWFSEVIPTRINDAEKSSIIVIQQRTHEEDVSGFILSNGYKYEHLCIPMRYDSDRHCTTSIGWSDPRTEDGELAWPERFSRAYVDQLEKDMGSYAASGQLQQSPSPRGGGIIKREWWRYWDDEEDIPEQFRGKYPPFSYVVASLDPAYTAREENDYSAFSVWGVFAKDTQRAEHGVRLREPKVMLMWAWQERLELHALCQRVQKDCARWGANTLLIEPKATGLSVEQEMRRLYSSASFNVRMPQPEGDKVARAYSISPMIEGGQVYVPNRAWAQPTIDQLATLPKCAHDDAADSATQALIFLRKHGLLVPSQVVHDAFDDEVALRPATGRLYPC